MSKKFSWNNFEVGFIKSVLYSERTPKSLKPPFDTDDKVSLLPYMDSICPRPDEHFVRRYRKEIMENFFFNGTHLVSLVKGLQKNRYRGVSVGSLEEMRQQVSALRLTSTVITLILAELYREGNKRISEDDEFSLFTVPKILDINECVGGDVPLYDYQKEAVNAMHKYFVTEDKCAGILTMPTGSGKTRVASRFLIESFVSKGWQVIWLTHRAMLIEQTARSIYQTAGALLKNSAPEKETFKMVCVSGSHASVKCTEKDDDVMIFGVQSLIRNLPYLEAVVGEKVMVVVDEAHHTLAPSYKIIIKEIQRIATKSKLLGLTATPVRMTPEDTASLMKIFDSKIIYNVSMSKLVADGYLSEPCYSKVDTNIDFETTITLDEQKYIRKWGELSPETMEKMARMKERNTLIADTYVKNKEKYGKTLIFALNSTHCIALCEELQKRGIRCDYIYCAHSGNEEKISRFQRGELDVLVNIQVLTEGSDVPDIQTVFLTRPTSSDVLLMQMIGRGMRGEGSGGTKTVNIVDFCDVWGSFSYWLSASMIIDMMDVDTDTDEEIREEIIRKEREMVPWAMFRDIINGIDTSCIDANGDLTVSLPVGWYDIIDEDGLDSKVLVFESQLTGYLEMWKQKKETLDNPYFNGEKAVEMYFDDICLLPNANDIDSILELYRMSGEFPHFNQFKERNIIDAAVVAKKLVDANIGIADLDNKIKEVYVENSQIIDSVYGSFENYTSRVIDFIRYPSGIKPIGMKIEEIEEETLAIDLTPVYDINELTAEVIEEMFDGAYGELPKISWTNLRYTGYYGKYFYRNEGDFIRINSVLNSKDVPKETVKYIIYHELLHRDYRYHNNDFRREEHKFPDWTTHERFLDFTLPKFDTRYSI